jgi:hypothetical protein
MVMQVLWGEMSATALRSVVDLLATDLEAAKSGNLSKKAIIKIASCGDSGKYPNHIWRDFQNMMPDSKIPVHWMQCPFSHIQLGDFTRTLHHHISYQKTLERL